MAGLAVDRPVFVIGCGRSGTTMLFEMLKAHPGLAPTTGHPDGEDHVGWVTHGRAVISGIYGNAETGNTGEALGHACCLHMTAEDVTPEIRDAMHRYYREEVLRDQAGKRVVNKCPHLSNKLGYVQAIFPDARIIHLVRDPVAMTASWINIMSLVPDLTLYWPETAFPCLWVLPRKGDLTDAVLARNDRFYPGGGLLRFADYWNAINGGIPIQATPFASQVLTVRYEDLIGRPDETLRTITDFCDIEPFAASPVTIDTGRNKLRRSLLSEEEVAEIRRRTRDVALGHGYA